MSKFGKSGQNWLKCQKWPNISKIGENFKNWSKCQNWVINVKNCIKSQKLHKVSKIVQNV